MNSVNPFCLGKCNYKNANIISFIKVKIEMSFLEEEFVIIDPAGKRIVHINVKILEKIPIMFSFINFLDYSIVVLLHFCDISKAFSDILVYKKGSFVQFTCKKVFIYTFIRKENAKQHPETELLLFKNYSYSLYML